MLVELRSLRTAGEAVTLADANLRLAEQTLAAEQARSDEGDVILKDVFDARQDVESARAEAAKARIDVKMAQVKLLRPQGALTAQELP